MNIIKDINRIEVIFICDDTLIKMGYEPFFNDDNPHTEHEFTMLFENGIARELSVENEIKKIKNDKDSIVLLYPRQDDTTNKQLIEIKKIAGGLDNFQIALLYGRPYHNIC